MKDHDQVREDDRDRHRRKVAHRVVGQVGDQVRRDRERADVREVHEVAVGRALRRHVGGDVAARAGLVVDHHLLAEARAERALHHARDRVGAAARGEADDEADRAAWILRERRGAGERQRGDCKLQIDPHHTTPP
jgi:hypothetical protein